MQRRRRIAVAGWLALAAIAAAPTVSGGNAPAPPSNGPSVGLNPTIGPPVGAQTRSTPPCRATLRDYKKFARAHYKRGHIKPRDGKQLGQIGGCLPDRRTRRAARRFRRHLIEHQTLATMSRTNASWYDGSAPFCGHHYRLGFAHRTMPCGTRVTFCRGSRCVVGRVEDRGPAAWTGRDFDLTPGLKAALGCGDTCDLHWRRGRL